MYRLTLLIVAFFFSSISWWYNTSFVIGLTNISLSKRKIVVRKTRSHKYKVTSVSTTKLVEDYGILFKLIPNNINKKFESQTLQLYLKYDSVLYHLSKEGTWFSKPYIFPPSDWLAFFL